MPAKTTLPKAGANGTGSRSSGSAAASHRSPFRPALDDTPGSRNTIIPGSVGPSTSSRPIRSPTQDFRAVRILSAISREGEHKP